MATTNLQEQKLELIQWLSVVDDVAVIDRVAKVREETVSEWWHEISESERESITKGLEQADSGQLKPHSEARAKYDKWL